MGDSSTKSTVIKGLVVVVGMIAVAIVAVLVTLATVSKGEKVGLRKAVAVIDVGTSGTPVEGFLELTQENSEAPVLITGEIKGLSPSSSHGFHVHGSGDVRKGCASTGAHFNPANVTHAGPTAESRHVGDLGNIETDATGTAKVNITDKIISLSGPHSIIGRAFVVHSGKDDLGLGKNEESLKTGNAGSRVGCGIIGII